MILSSHLATLHQTHFPCLAIGVGFVGCEITGAWRVSFISVPLVPVEEIRGMCITNVVGVFMSMMFSGYFRPRKRTESERRRVFISRVERWGPGGALTRLILSNGLSTIKTRDWLHVKSEGRCQGYSSWRGGVVINLAALHHRPPEQPTGAPGEGSACLFRARSVILTPATAMSYDSH